ncbi:winged helix-turn-helix domain-containing protein [Cryptosporangium sp. NPDC051539]|uniref:winged helix-turn-helix domain-containing protein n=1 Tax=Cryptosporangium sp. NPDC051539 TaxID=3363962 RepID=UPI00378D9BFB
MSVQSLSPQRRKARPAGGSSSASIVVEVAVSGSDALEAATRLAREIRDLLDSAGADPSGVVVSASVGLQIGAGAPRVARPALSSVGTTSRPAQAQPAQARSAPGQPAPVQLPTFVAPAPRRPEVPAVPPVVAASVAPLQIYPERRVALLAGEALSLTRREFDLLLFLAEHAGRVFDRPQLLRLVWGHQVICGERTVDVHIRRLRAKIEKTGPVISTVRGVGYRLDAAERVAVLHDRA